jgi:hypothetical protein
MSGKPRSAARQPSRSVQLEGSGTGSRLQAASVARTVLREQSTTRAMALIGMPSDRYNRRISAQSSTLNTLPILWRAATFAASSTEEGTNLRMIVLAQDRPRAGH